MAKKRSKSTNLRFFSQSVCSSLEGLFLTKNFFHIMLGPMRFLLSDSFFLFNSCFEGIQMQNLLMIDFLFFMVCLGMMATLVANLPGKPVRFPAILGLFTPILITFFPWQILQKISYLDFWNFDFYSARDYFFERISRIAKRNAERAKSTKYYFDNAFCFV